MDSCGWRDISFSKQVKFNIEVPLLMNFNFGSSVVRMNPGLITRISVLVSFVSSSVIKLFFIVIGCSIVID